MSHATRVTTQISARKENVMADFDDRVAIVTGGSMGIGRAAALEFARRGAKVLISARSEGGQETADMIAAEGGEALFVRSDIARESDVETLVRTALQRWGKLDFALNNAGHSGKNAPIHEQTAENYDAVFDSNVRGMLFCLKHEIRAMLRNGFGRIVNVASDAGYIGFPTAGIYVASKHAVMGLTRSAALEVVDQSIRVNAVIPGSVTTRNFEIFTEGKQESKDYLRSIHPIGKFLTAEDVVPAIMFLCGPGAEFCVGTGLVIDGGIMTQ
jgi:NAD(P)-dependent dehydrogenase (short-subunit alcohol dehydrogenase family)